MTGPQCAARTYLMFTLGLTVMEARWAWKTWRAMRQH